MSKAAFVVADWLRTWLVLPVRANVNIRRTRKMKGRRNAKTIEATETIELVSYLKTDYSTRHR